MAARHQMFTIFGADLAAKEEGGRTNPTDTDIQGCIGFDLEIP